MVETSGNGRKNMSAWQVEINANCDGGGPCLPGEVRVLPTGGDGNAILCARCYRREMTFRRDRNRDLDKDAQFDIPAWKDLKVYDVS